MKKVFRIFTVAVRALLLAVIALLLIYNIYTLIARYAYGKNIPTIFGFGCAVVETGSMEPSISAGDLIFIQEKEQYFVGDIITFFDSSHNEYVTHRIIFTSEQGYVTKGDANSGQDLFTVPQGAVVGKVIGVWGGGGSAVVFLQTPAGIFTFILSAAAVWGITTGVSFMICRVQKKGQDTSDISPNDPKSDEEA